MLDVVRQSRRVGWQYETIGTGRPRQKVRDGGTTVLVKTDMAASSHSQRNGPAVSRRLIRQLEDAERETHQTIARYEVVSLIRSSDLERRWTGRQGRDQRTAGRNHKGLAGRQLDGQASQHGQALMDGKSRTGLSVRSEMEVRAGSVELVEQRPGSK